MTALREIMEAMAICNSPDEAISLLVVKLRAATGADCCSLYLTDHRKTRLRLMATDGLSPNAVGKVSLKIGEGLVGVVGQKRELLSLSDAPSHPKFKYLPEVGEDEFHSFLGVPVLHQGELLGVLVIQTRKMRRFDELEESFLVTLSTQIASMIAISSHTRDPDDVTVKRIKGRSGTGGLALGQAAVWRPEIAFDDVPLLCSDDPELQIELFKQTVFQLQLEMDRTAFSMQEKNNHAAVNGYIAGYGHMLDDQKLQEDIGDLIRSRGLMASSAIHEVISGRMQKALEAGDHDEFNDLRSFGEQLMTRIVHGGIDEINFSESTILVVENLPPSLVAELPRDKISGFVSINGSDSSHAALLARDLGIPAVFGAPLDLSRVDGRYMIVNGRMSEVLLDPSASVISEFRELRNLSLEQSNLFWQEREDPPRTLDGELIDVRLNAGLNQKSGDLRKEIAGIGLYRTEIAYMLTQSFPSEQQQTEWYLKLLEEFAPLPVCMRTLDVGSDKGLSYLPLKEPNPALGWRGVRITIDQPQILTTQLRAMMRAQQKYGNLQIMIPMVSRLEEVRTVRRLIEEARLEVEEQTHEKVTPPPFGVMIEVPSVLFLIPDLAREVDFFSVGSNDLIQYLLAVDRSNPRVSRFFDSFHPAVLRALDQIARACEQSSRKVAVCGEIAGTPLGAMMLLSLGIRQLSMNYSELARVKYILRRVSVSELKALGIEALRLRTGDEIHRLYLDYAVSHGLGDIIGISHEGLMASPEAGPAKA